MSKLNFKKRIIATVVSATVVFSMLICVGFSNKSFADAESQGFIVRDYHVEVKVTEDHIYKVTEYIRCDFSEERHGIYREIPTKNASIKNIDASTNWEKEGDTIRLGDEDFTVSGLQDYALTYDYVCDQDDLEGIDEFYFNIIGSGWETDIEHATFSIDMPADFDSKAVGFSMGSYGTVGTAEGELLHNIDGKTITGETLRTLEPGEALTIRIELPDGYFSSNQSILDLWRYFVIGILTLVSIFLCFKLGRDEKIIPVIQFEPPKEYNSLQLGVIDHLDARDDDVVSLLIYLADKGYLSIEPLPDWHKNIEKTKKFRFHKLKEYKGDNISEKVFLDGLFENGSTVDSKDLEKSFYRTVKEICIIEKDFTKELVERKGRIPITIFLILTLFLMWMPSWEYGGFMDYVFSLSYLKLIGFLIGLACIVIMLVCWGLIQRRTPLGVELAGKSKGLAEFIDTAEKDRIEQLVEQDPESFYKILPYAMALGITDKWIEKFRGITIPRPSWYAYNTPYLDGYIIGNMLNSNLYDTMSKAGSTSSSSGGGGFSGGGAGGGGGGSW